MLKNIGGQRVMGRRSDNQFGYNNNALRVQRNFGAIEANTRGKQRNSKGPALIEVDNKPIPKRK